MRTTINSNELLSVIARCNGVTVGELALIWNTNQKSIQAALARLEKRGAIVSEIQRETSGGETTWLVCWRAA